ncbi:MAG TPA: hypothetical protein VHO90_12280 [Bacteroidales bacterium]|jgi:hypothetical protein|nr:hypothetical protein [Bacteroidales bacterium]
MKKKSKKIVPNYSETRGYDAQVYQNYDLEMRIVQNMNKEKPLYSLE